MKLVDAKEKIDAIAGLPFSKLFTSREMDDIIRNKGRTGQLLEMALGMQLSNRETDFEDGELKTNKCDRNGKPLETIFVTQIARIIDELLQGKSFRETSLFKKIRNILYVPVSKSGHPSEWMFLPSVHVDTSTPVFSHLVDIWEKDYYVIGRRLNEHINNAQDGFIHTTNGKHLQVRSKDTKPYTPIYSDIYGREVSNKNHAFYFQREFVFHIQKLNQKILGQ